MTTLTMYRPQPWFGTSGADLPTLPMVMEGAVMVLYGIVGSVLMKNGGTINCQPLCWIESSSCLAARLELRSPELR